MQRLSLFFLLALLLGSCSPETRRVRQWQRYVKTLKQQPPVAPDSTSGTYQPTLELDMLDELLRKYPGKQVTRTITHTETKTLPGKTVYVELPVRADTTGNRAERDSLLQALQTLVQRERADSELRAKFAELRANMLAAFNRRACLPDTLVKFPAYGITLQVKRGQSGAYGFTIVEAPQKVDYPSHVTENVHERVVYLDSKFWQFWQFWLALVVAGRGLLWKAILLLKSLVFP